MIEMIATDQCSAIQVEYLTVHHRERNPRTSLVIYVISTLHWKL